MLAGLSVGSCMFSPCPLLFHCRAELTPSMDTTVDWDGDGVPRDKTLLAGHVNIMAYTLRVILLEVYLEGGGGGTEIYVFIVTITNIFEAGKNEMCHYFA